MGITMICLNDINRFAGTHYVSADRWDLRKSLEMFKLYVSHYATEERIGCEVSQADIARIWNGGPNGWKKTATWSYWTAVHDYMTGDARESVQEIVRKVEETM